MKAYRFLSALVVLFMVALAGATKADTVTFRTVASGSIAAGNYGATSTVTAYGPGKYASNELGGEFLFTVNTNSLGGSTSGDLSSITKDGGTSSTIFKTFCIDVHDNISTGTEYYVSLDTTIPLTILHSGSGGTTVTNEMAYVAGAYRTGVFNASFASAHSLANDPNAIAAAVQLELWSLLGTPGAASANTAAANAWEAAIDTYVNAHLADWTSSLPAAGFPKVGVMNLYNKSDHSLAQSQLVFIDTPPGGTTDTPLPGVLWAGLPLLGAVAVRRKLSGRRSM